MTGLETHLQRVETREVQKDPSRGIGVDRVHRVAGFSCCIPDFSSSMLHHFERSCEMIKS